MIYELLADGFEELEAIAPLDLLRRAGVAVATVGIGAKTVTGSHGVTLTCDLTDSEIDPSACEGVILPGGPGHVRLAASPAVLALLEAVAARGDLLAAICAAPSILGENGYLQGKRACCFPGFEDRLLGAEVLFDPVVTDGNVITSRGAGTALPFALAMIEWLCSPEDARRVAGEIQCP